MLRLHRPTRWRTNPLHLKMMALPRWKRPFTRRGMRHIGALALGAALGITGSTLASVHINWMPTGVWHGLAYLLHAFGFIPVLKHGEPFWDMLTGGINSV